MTEIEVVVVGAGPAGVAAAIQLVRHGIEVALFEADAVGGLARNAQCLENLPGFPHGISGAAFCDRLERQLAAAGVEPVREEVTSVSYREGFVLRTEAGSLGARRVIVAAGTEPLPLPAVDRTNEVDLRLVHEARQLRGLHGARVAIIGAGDAAFDSALGLAEGNEVVILGRSLLPRCLPLLWERSRASAGVRFEPEAIVRRIAAFGDTLAVEYERRSGPATLRVDHVLVAVGRRPRLGFLDAQLRRRRDALRSAGRLYLVGDVANGRFRQVAIAVGDGVRAAMEIAGSSVEEATCAS